VAPPRTVQAPRTVNPPRHRLAVILSHPVQYYSPWFRELATAPELELRVFYLWDFGVAERRDPQFGRAFRWDVDLLSGYDSEFVPNVARDPGTHHFGGLDNPGLGARLGAYRPDAVLLFGYNWKALLGALLWCRRRGVPVLLRGDSHWLGRGRPPFARRLALQVLFRQFAGFLTVGAANRDYYATLGIPSERLFFAPHAVDATHFDPRRPEPVATAAALRRELGLEGKRVLLFAGKFRAAKQPGPLLEAFLDVAGPQDALVFVGDGEEREALVSRAASRPDLLVRFLPFANQSEMPSRYLLGDVFVLPSRGSYETWGLAVNEAMHLGRPCLVSDLVGCQRDLIAPGETGWVFPAEDQEALKATLRAALQTDAARLEAMGRAALGRVAEYSYARAKAGLIAALGAVV
jgi:glycosyltransferase involved in cell wall biosynthesis